MELLGLLRSEEGFSVGQLADRLSVSRRTLFRDLKSLEKLGVSAHFDESGQRYRVTISDDLAAKAEITPAELSALLQLKADHNETITSEQAAEILKRVGIFCWLDDPERSPISIEPLINAISCGHEVAIETAEGPQAIQPLRLLFSRGTWFLLSRRDDSAEPNVRTLSKISALTVSQRRFEVPSVSEVDRLLARAWELDSGTPKAVIRFDPPVARRVFAEPAEDGSRTTWLDNGAVVASVPVHDESSFVPWVMSFGSQATVLKPPHLRERIVGEFRQSAENYARLM